MADSSASPPRRDALTVAAIGVVVFLVSVLFHELTHAATAAAQGSKVYIVTNAHVEHEDKLLSSAGNQAVAASATLAQFLLALVLAILWKKTPRESPRLRYALWLGMAVNTFMPAGYLLMSPFFGFGDWTTFINLANHSQALAWKIGLTAIGAALYMGLLPRLLRPGFDEFLGKAEPERTKRKKVFSLLPYLCGSFTSFAVSLLNPHGAPVWVTGAFASFGGMIGVAHMGWMWSKEPLPESPEEPPPFDRSVPWIVAAAVVFAVDFFVFGPGITFHKH